MFYKHSLKETSSDPYVIHTVGKLIDLSAKGSSFVSMLTDKGNVYVHYINLLHDEYDMKLNDVIQIDSNEYYGLALTREGTIIVWNLNQYDDVLPKLTIIDDLKSKNIKNMACGIDHYLALTEDGKVYSWGKNDNGQLGLGHRYVFCQRDMKPRLIPLLDHIVQIGCGCFFSYAVDNNGNIYTWGMNCNGQLGLGDNRDRYSPELVTTMKLI